MGLYSLLSSILSIAWAPCNSWDTWTSILTVALFNLAVNLVKTPGRVDCVATEEQFATTYTLSEIPPSSPASCAARWISVTRSRLRVAQWHSWERWLKAAGMEEDNCSTLTSTTVTGTMWNITTALH